MSPNWISKPLNSRLDRIIEMMNKLILLDGTYGVGKTTVALQICSVPDNMYICIDPDEIFNNNLEKYMIHGWPAANNSLIKRNVRNEVKDRIQNVNIVIPLTLNTQLYVDGWTNLFSDIADVRHVILFADTEIVKNRIVNDVGRDKDFALEQLHNNDNYYRRDFEGDVKIDTSDLTTEEVAEKIMKSIL